MLVLCYKNCSTCRKALAWLKTHGEEYTYREITEENPTADELKLWHEKSGLPLRRFFNTSGGVYRQLGLKDKLDSMTPAQQYALLATDGMLVRRPIVVSDAGVLVGFREKEWQEMLG